MREVVAELRSLRLHGMAQRYEELVAEGGSGIQMAEWLIRALRQSAWCTRGCPPETPAEPVRNFVFEAYHVVL